MAQEFNEEDLFFANLISKADMLSLLSFIDALCQYIGFRDPEGLSVDDRFYKQRTLELEALFRSLENSNPRLAARLHDRYEEARKKLGEDRL
jgi:hypothetical protein